MTHRPRQRILIACLAALTLLGGTMARGAEPIGPEDAVRIALENQPMLLAADEEVRAAEAERKLANSGYLPRIELTEDWMRSDNPVFAFSSKLLQGVFTPADFDIQALNNPDAITNSMTRVNVYQSIWNGGRTGLHKRAASAAIAAAEQSRKRTRDDVVFDAVRSFWDLVLAEEMLRVTRDAEAAAEANLSLATELVDAGLAVSSDRLSAEVRKAEVEAMHIRAEYGVEVAHAALLRAMGLEGDRRFEAIPAEPGPLDQTETLDYRQEYALASRPDLLALERQIEQAQVGTRMAKRGYYPEIGALGRYEWNGEQLLGNDGRNWALGVSLRVTIFDGNGTKAQAARARAGLSRLEAVRTAMRQGIRLEVTAAWADRESAWRRLDVAAAARDRAAEALRIVRERYGEGLGLIVELLGAEAAFTEAQAHHAAALSESWLARASLDLASGMDPLAPSATTPSSDQS